MTTTRLLGTVRRRWYVLLAGCLLTLAGLAWVTQHQPVYATQFNIVLLPPEQEDVPNQLRDGPYSLAEVAGVVAVEVGEERPVPTASPDTTLYGVGEVSAIQVRVPNRGNQWQPQYTSPYLDVQVVDSSPDAVRAQADEVVSRVAESLARRQQELGLPRSAWVTSLPSSADPVVFPVAGSRPRALLAVTVVGVGGTAMLVHGLEVLAARRRRSQGTPDTADSR